MFEASPNLFPVALDLAGFGETGIPLDLRRYTFESVCQDLEKLISHLGFDSTIVIGHNWGSHVGFHLSRTRPGLVKAIISISSGYTPIPILPERLIAKFPYLGYQLNLAKEKNCSRFDANIALFLESFWCYSYPSILESCLAVPPDEDYISFVKAIKKKGIINPDREVLDYTLNQFKKTGTWGATNWYRTYELNHQLATSLPIKPELSLPVLLLVGEEDFAASKMRNGTEYLQDFTVKSISNAGHFVHVSHAKEIGELVLTWLYLKIKLPINSKS